MSISRCSITWSIVMRWVSTSNIDRSIVSGLSPCDIVRFPCGSRSMQRERRARAAAAAPGVGGGAALGEGHSEVERGRRLRDPALLVRERDHLWLRRALPLRRGRADVRPRYE